MIITVDAGKDYSSMILDAWKHGVEVEKLDGKKLEFISGRDEKVEALVKRYPQAKVIHREKLKEVSIYDQPI